MLSVFNAIPLQLGAFTTFNPFVTRAASAASETTNEMAWIIQVDC